MANTNYSLAGAETQKLSTLNKIGIAVFVFGGLGLLQLGTKFTFLDKSIGLLFDNKALTKVFTENYGYYLSFVFFLVGTFLFTKKSLKADF